MHRPPVLFIQLVEYHISPLPYAEKVLHAGRKRGAHLADVAGVETVVKDLDSKFTHHMRTPPHTSDSVIGCMVGIPKTSS